MILNEIDNVYLGNSAVDKIYLGSQLMWPSVVPPTPTGGTRIYYTSTNGNIVVPNKATGWTANIVSNTYVDGQGCIEFDGEITEVPMNAFGSIIGDILKSMVIPDTVTELQAGSFARCNCLRKITLSANLKTIGPSAFVHCRVLEEVVIPAKVSNIALHAFYQCTNLSSVTLLCATPPTLESMVFDNTGNCPIYVPAGSVDAYKQAAEWSNYANRIFPIA